MSILEDVKTIIGVPLETTSFDKELLFDIRTVATVLVQLGVDEYSGLNIDENTEWVVLMDANLDALIQRYLVSKVKNMFDPKSNQSIATILESHIVELEERVMLIVNELKDAEEEV